MPSAPDNILCSSASYKLQHYGATRHYLYHLY